MLVRDFDVCENMRKTMAFVIARRITCFANKIS